MSFTDSLRNYWGRLFPIKDIKTALNIKVALSETMLDKIELWQNCYSGNAPWLSEDVVSVGLEDAICVEFSNIVFNEMELSVSNPELDKIFRNAIDDINENFQSGLATGGIILKPLGADKGIQYVPANEFIPVEYDSKGKLLKVIFPDFKKIGDSYYTRLEYHCLDDNGLTITNTAYISADSNYLGREIPLTVVEEWGNLPVSVNYPLMTRQAFGYYRNPKKNNIDNSKTPISIFNKAIEIIKKADIQFGRMDWEFESGERMVFADESLFKGKDKNKFLAKLKNRLFKKVDADGDVNSLIKEYSPEFRIEALKTGLEEIKRTIEFCVGLAYGDLSNTSNVDKTATEVKVAKQRKYNTVTAIQENVKDCLEDLVFALAFYNSMTTSGYEFSCVFKDSILTDEAEERKQDIQDVNMGVMSKAEYRAKWYGEDEETAKSRLPENAEVIE